jgi:hypothetical protein
MAKYKPAKGVVPSDPRFDSVQWLPEGGADVINNGEVSVYRDGIHLGSVRKAGKYESALTIHNASKGRDYRPAENAYTLSEIKRDINDMRAKEQSSIKSVGFRSADPRTVEALNFPLLKLKENIKVMNEKFSTGNLAFHRMFDNSAERNPLLRKLRSISGNIAENKPLTRYGLISEDILRHQSMIERLKMITQPRYFAPKGLTNAELFGQVAQQYNNIYGSSVSVPKNSGEIYNSARDLMSELYGKTEGLYTKRSRLASPNNYREIFEEITRELLTPQSVATDIASNNIVGSSEYITNRFKELGVSTKAITNKNIRGVMDVLRRHGASLDESTDRLVYGDDITKLFPHMNIPYGKLLS